MQKHNGRPWAEHCRRKLVDPKDVASLAASIKREGHTIVTLNGSFDILHAGHLFTIFEAAALADVLIMALNTDASVKSYKGSNRPIIPLSCRLELISAIECVDYLTWFDEPDPRNILDKIAPHVHANGIEYGENCIEKAVVEKHGGRVHLIPRIGVGTLATSDIIKKVCSICA